MLDTIREIGIFMIAAQAVVHFAPGRQYEKYIKSVSGIIILLLFLQPVLRFSGIVWEEPQALLEKWGELTDIADIDNTKKEELERKYKFTKTFVTHYIENSANISTSEEHNPEKLKFIDWYKKSPDTLRTLVRVVDPKIKDVMIDTDNKYEELLFILKDGSKITRSMLSTGTERFLNTIRNVNKIIDKNGILIVDEIEQNLHKDLVGLIIRLFGEMSKNNSQIIFTTLSPEIFDISNKENKKIFKQDSIFILNSDYDDIKIDKLMDLKIDGERVKGDASVANLYKSRKISVHPNIEQIKIFLENFNN